jgi:hypothetical protein
MPNEKTDGNAPLITSIIAAICIILYIGALAYGALNIYNSITERHALGDREFDRIADLASAAGVLGFMDEPFIQTIQDAVDGSETILGVIITGSRGEFAFERERGTVITWVNNSPRFVTRFAVTNPPKHLPLRVEGQRNANIFAVSGYLDYHYCVDILKRTLLITLFALTLAFFTLLMDALLMKNRVHAPQDESPAMGGKNVEESGAFPEDDLTLAEPATEAPAPEIFEEEAGDREDLLPDDLPDMDTLPEDELEEELEEPELEDELEEPELEEEELEEPELEEPELEEDEPELELGPDESAVEGVPSLFSPRGNIGWETYTEDRLESELHRCASAEQDLALIVMAFSKPEKLSKEQFRRFSDETVLFFEHRDLIFEYREQGISVICPNYSLEQCFDQAEEFNSRMFSRLPRTVGSKVDLRLGISSRAGRLIDAGRIMLEAAEALKRAAVDPVSHVVAFKSDPEKYRQYISEHQS